MNPVTVIAEPDAVTAAAAVLASLPVSYAPGDTSQPPEVTITDGGAGWPARTLRALQAGSTGAIVIHPEPADITALSGSTQTVVLDSSWAGNPAVETAAHHFRRAAAAAQLLECRMITRPGRSVAARLLDAAALLRALVGPVSELTLLQHDATSFIAAGVIGKLATSISVLTSAGLAPHAYVRVLTDDGGVEIAIPHPETARPAEIVITDEAGVRTLPTLWESSHRAAWRRAHLLLQAGDPGTDLSDFADDQAVLGHALSELAEASATH